MTGTALLVVVGLASATWLLWRLPTPSAVAGTVAAAVRASVVIPARDEEESLPRLLASLAVQRPPPAEVLVVDDQSTDRTAELAARAGATVVTAKPPPPGWLGKPWACHTGAAAATGEVLVFLDADTWLGPDGLARLLAAHAVLAPAGLLSVQPFHAVVRPAEQLSAFPNLVAMMASGAFAPRSLMTRPVAFGPCLVTGAAAHRRAGGHAGVRSEVIEDVHLARAHRRVGQPVACLAGGADVAFRMYPRGLPQLVEGWSKNLAGGALLTAPLPTLGAVAWVSGVAAAALAGGAAVAGAARGHPVAWEAVVAWAAVSAHLAWALRRIGSYRWWVPAAFAVPLLAFMALFVRSLALRGVRRRVRWRGRDISLRGEGSD